MRRIVLYIAQSLDGYIARPNGAVDWLDEVPHAEGEDYGYAEFYDGVDTLLMGRQTWQVVEEMDVPWPYTGKKCYVFTRDTGRPPREEVEFVTANPADFARDLKKGAGKDIWLVGGGQINGLLLEQGVVDEVRLFLMPVLLGDGLALTGLLDRDIPLRLSEHRTYASGVVALVYHTVEK